MGRLELRKYDAKIYLKDNKVVTNLPIDWDKTLRLWYEDKESYDNRTLVRMEEKEVFKSIIIEARQTIITKPFMSSIPIEN